MSRIIICKICKKEKERCALGMCELCYHRQYRESHRDEINAKHTRYRERNRDKINVYFREFQKKNPDHARKYRERYRERIKTYQRQWAKKNRGKRREYLRRYRARKSLVADTLTPEQLEFERRIGEATYLGEKLHLHHIVPISKGGGHTWGNIMFIPAFLNFTICDKLPEEVYEQIALEI